MDARERRLAQNEALFRSVNERIEDAAQLGKADEHVYEFLCECSNADCTLFLPLTVAQFEEARRDPTQFIVAPGHDLPEIESVVALRTGYQIVKKRGEAAELATEHDERSDP